MYTAPVTVVETERSGSPSTPRTQMASAEMASTAMARRVPNPTRSGPAPGASAASVTKAAAVTHPTTRSGRAPFRSAIA